MPERDQLEVDVLFVGAGPASFAGAIRLGQLAQEAGRALEILVIEKAGEVGNHGISGAVMDPRALDELLPDWRESAPVESPVTSDELWFLTDGRQDQSAVHAAAAATTTASTSPRCRRCSEWLGEQAEEAGAQVFPAFPGQELLWDGDRVIGVRTGDKGLDHNGKPKSNYEPGADILAKVVVLGEGPRGTLAKQAIARLGLADGREPQVYAAGVKELWQLPDDRFKAGSVIHTLGYPLPRETFGGGFIYGMSGNVLDIGIVTGLDYKNPTTDPHNELQRNKEHPAIAKMLEGGDADPLRREGDSRRRPLCDAARRTPTALLIVGDTAGFLNGMRLKGIHLGMKSGMMAAETVWDALQADALRCARRSRRSSGASRNRGPTARCGRARNFHQGFKQRHVAGHDQRGPCDVYRRRAASASSTSSRGEPVTSGW